MDERGSQTLIGYTGFVGGNLLRHASFEALYNSANIHQLSGTAHGHMVIAAPQAKKWWANQNPQEDWKAIEGMLDQLARCSAGRVTLISTIDVLGSVAGLTERDPPNTEALTPYGLHRLKLEKAVETLFERVLVVRLPGLFGPGLKKNVIFDLVNRNALEAINPRSSYQYYDLGQLWAHVQTAWMETLELVHLFPEPVTTQELIERFFPNRQVGSDATPETHYDHRTVHGALFGGNDEYIADKDTVIRRIELFLTAQTDAAP